MEQGQQKRYGWAVSVFAYNPKGQTSYHQAISFDASSFDEAYGRAMQLCKKRYPAEKGYIGHNVSVVTTDVSTDQE